VSLEKLVSRYIASAEHVLGELEIVADEGLHLGKDSVLRIVDLAKAICRTQNIIETTESSR
jgi:hypothetical protein